MAKKKTLYQDNVDWDDMSYGEASHHINKKMTQKIYKSPKDYSRKEKNKKNWKGLKNSDENFDY
jgi:hypothetical protein